MERLIKFNASIEMEGFKDEGGQDNKTEPFFFPANKTIPVVIDKEGVNNINFTYKGFKFLWLSKKDFRFLN
jgi:hypothetical protein